MKQIEKLKDLSDQIKSYTEEAMALTESLEKAIKTGQPQWEAVYKNCYASVDDILRELSYQHACIEAAQCDMEELY